MNPTNPKNLRKSQLPIVEKPTQVITSSKKKTKTYDRFTVSVAGITLSELSAKSKPSRITFDVLRNLRDINPLVNVCIETLKHIVVKIPYTIHTKKDVSNDLYQAEIKYLEDLLSQPNPQDTHRSFWLKIIEDVLTIDRGCIEFVRNGLGWIVEMWPVDGATVMPCLDDFGMFCSPAFVQIFNTDYEPTASFEEQDIAVVMNSPLYRSGMIGYGKSPVERVILSILTSINAENFNAQTFTKNNMPPYMVNIKGADQKGVLDVKTQWEAQQNGNLWKGIFTNGEDIVVQKLRESNQDMQYYELTLWIAKIIIAAFELSPQDIGLTMDINKATGEVQQNITKNQAIKNMLSLIAEAINIRVIKDLSEYNPNFANLEFEFDELDKIDEKTQAEIDQINVTIGKVIADELRARDGMKPLSEAQSTTSSTVELSPEQQAYKDELNIGASNQPAEETTSETPSAVPSTEGTEAVSKAIEEDEDIDIQQDKFQLWYSIPTQTN